MTEGPSFFETSKRKQKGKERSQITFVQYFGNSLLKGLTGVIRLLKHCYIPTALKKEAISLFLFLFQCFGRVI